MQPALVIQHAAHEDAGVFAETAAREGLKLEIIHTWLGEEVPLEPGAHPALLVMGGAMNVDDAGRYPFLTRELELIRAAHSASVPVLGICLGSQLIAAALGARVYDGPVKEIGWYGIELTDEAAADPLFEGQPRRQTVFEWHGQTFDLPAGAVRLAGSAKMPNQAFRLGETTWAIQYHLETTGAHVKDWLARGTEDYAGLDYIDPRGIEEAIIKHEPACRALAGRLFRRFMRLAAERATGGQTSEQRR